jgi:hypothetical protein
MISDLNMNNHAVNSVSQLNLKNQQFGGWDPTIFFENGMFYVSSGIGSTQPLGNLLYVPNANGGNVIFNNSPLLAIKNINFTNPVGSSTQAQLTVDLASDNTTALTWNGDQVLTVGTLPADLFVSTANANLDMANYSINNVTEVNFSATEGLNLVNDNLCIKSSPIITEANLPAALQWINVPTTYKATINTSTASSFVFTNLPIQKSGVVKCNLTTIYKNCGPAFGTQASTYQGTFSADITFVYAYDYQHNISFVVPSSSVVTDYCGGNDEQPVYWQIFMSNSTAVDPTLVFYLHENGVVGSEFPNPLYLTYTYSEY